MYKYARLASTFALLTMLFIGLSSTAHAAPSAWEFVDVSLHIEQDRPLLLVSGDLPDDAPLPYSAELAVPAGTQLQWIGEILGGPPAQDPQIPYVKSTVGDMDIYTFTLTRSRTAQFEGVASGVTAANGLDQTSALKWTAWQDLPSVRIAQRLPRGSQIVEHAEGASMQPGDESVSYYAKTVTNAKAGDVLDLTFSYTLPTSAPSASASGSSSTAIATVFIGAAVLLLIGIAVVLMKRTAAPAPTAVAAKPAAKPAEKPKQKVVTPQPELQAEKTPRSRGILSPKLIMLGALVVVVVVAFAALGNGGSVKNGKITKFFGSTSPCSSTSLLLMPNEGVDLSKQGKDIVDAFSGYDGIGDVTLEVATATLDITFCSSSQTEEAVRQIVEGTGLVTLAAAPVASAPTTATIDPTGTKQTAAVDTSTGSFNPGTVILTAGVPAEIAFGQAVSCLTEVVIAGLGITQDLTAGPATVVLPPLEAGTYAFACAMGHQSGSIVVQ